MRSFFRRGRSKYNNVKTQVDGITFDSKKEAYRYEELKMLEKNKLIQNLRLQVPYVIMDGFRDRNGKKHLPIKYIADFVYEMSGNEYVEDVKGRLTAVYKLKKKLLLQRYPDILFIES